MFDELIGKTGFSLDRLQTLCDIAESGSIAEATKGDTNRQSQYSRQIKELETFFQTDLLNRESRPHRLTKDGLALARITREYFGQLTDFISHCQNRPTSLSIGSGESTIQWLLLPNLLIWREHLPNTAINLMNLRTMEVVDQLNDGSIDLGLIRKTALRNTSLKSLGSVKFAYRLFVPNRMRIKLPDKIKVHDIADLPIAVVNSKGEFRTRLNSLATDAGVALNIQLEVSSMTQVANVISSGLYCGFLPEFADNLVGNKARLYQVEGFNQLDRELVFAWNPGKLEMRVPLQKAIEIVKQEFT